MKKDASPLSMMKRQPNFFCNTMTVTLSSQTVKSLPAIFALDRKDWQYDFRTLDHVSAPVCDEEGTFPNLSLIYTADCEYTQKKIHAHQLRKRTHISAQVRHEQLTHLTGFYNHPESPYPIKGYPTLTDVAIIDYLKDAGYDISIRRQESITEMPTLTLVTAAHFALAEMRGIWYGEYLDDVTKLLVETSPKKPRIHHDKRLVASTPSGRFNHPLVYMPWVVTLDGVDYQVRLGFLDTVAMNGVASYEQICKGQGIDLPHKKVFNDREKSIMHLMAKKRPDDFVKYALGDLEVLKAYHAYCDGEKKKFEEMGVPDFYKEPKLTIGANVMELFRARCRTVIEFDSREGIQDYDKEWETFTDKHISKSSASHLRQNSARTSSLNSKVFGGRASNNVSSLVKIAEILANLDIDGAYANAQRLLRYPFGTPEVWDYPVDEVEKSAVTLKEFLREYGTSLDKIRKGDWGELVPGLFQIVVSTFDETLSFHQDYQPSWFLNTSENSTRINAKFINKLTSTDESFDDGFDFESTDFDEDDGSTKIIGRQIVNSTISAPYLVHLAQHYNASSGLQNAQVNELMSKLRVLTAVVCPKSLECKDLDDFLKQEEAWKEKTTNTRVKKRGRHFIRTEDGKFHGWFAVGLDKIAIDDLLINRKKYKKKTPMNDLYKLNCNTIYGDMTAKLFEEANVVVGNNITALVRHFCYMMEKALTGFQSITDGCAAAVNKVPYPRKSGRSISPTMLTHTSMCTATELNRQEIVLKPLGGFDKFVIDRVDEHILADGSVFKQPWVAGIKGTKRFLFAVFMGDDDINTYTVIKYPKKKDTAQQFFARIAKTHIQKLFPNDPYNQILTTAINVQKVDGNFVTTYQRVKGAYSLETKMIHEKAVNHGTANYFYQDCYNAKPTKAMRAYRDILHYEASLNDMSAKRQFNPASKFLSDLSNPTKVPRQKPFIKSVLIKSGEYGQRVDFFQHLDLYPGDAYWTAGLIREFSLSQFSSHFHTVEQYQAWVKTVSKDKELYGQSLERYFTNPDGTINVEVMSKVVCEMIHSGVKNYRTYFAQSKWFERQGKCFDSTALTHPYYDEFKQVKARCRMTFKDLPGK